MIDFNHRPVLVTGASGGIGGETVRQLVVAGADVIASGRSEEALSAFVAETGVRTLPFDLTSEESVMPLGRWAREAEIAAPMVFLLSDDASMITGVSLPIDGGYTIR
jgi:NAD(P)-dependent dehydrogenase (short-subunit alcohol dehydrogenase family)